MLSLLPLDSVRSNPSAQIGEALFKVRGDVMRKIFAALSFGLVLSANMATLSAQNSLFSEVRVNSAFSSSTAATRSPGSSSSDVPAKLTDAGQLSRMLQKVSFQPKEIGSQTVTAKQKLGDWSFPVLVMITENEQQLGIVLRLSPINEKKPISAAHLLDLLSANRQYAPSYFAYSKKRKRLELCHFMENHAITSTILRDEISRLASIAQETQSHWNPNFSDSKSAQDSTRAETSGAESASSTTTAAALLGTWSVVRSAKEAFAVEFKADSSFNLVHINQAKQVKTTGKFTLSGQSLKLTASTGEFSLTGSISLKSDKEFQLALSKSTILSFIKSP